MKTILFGILAASILATASYAQSEVNQRRENQQDRIANGVQSGQLTAGETAGLENREANINKEARTDRRQNGGNLTGSEKARINGQQNKLSNQLYQDKHNANSAQYGDNKVGQRRENQQDRISNGIRSGQLNAKQTSNLEKRESGINREVSADRKANGGSLTDNQKRKVNRQQNNVSGQIAKDKS